MLRYVQRKINTVCRWLWTTSGSGCRGSMRFNYLEEVLILIGGGYYKRNVESSCAWVHIQIYF